MFREAMTGKDGKSEKLSRKFREEFLAHDESGEGKEGKMLIDLL
jgi:hypothetical protein